MLRAVKIKNFIHFNDEHLLRFNKGANFFIGGNHTGKTSLYEAIRRCMSVSKSNGVSNAHDPDTLSYITCVYETDEGEASSSVMRLPTIDTGTCDQGFLKIVYTPFEKCVHADLVKKNKHGKLVCEQLPMVIVDTITETYISSRELNFHDAVLKLVESKSHLNRFLKNDFDGKYTETKCEKFLKAHVDDHAVIIFPFRSISPFESTISEARPKKRRGHIATKVTKRADILKWYLEQSQKDKIKEPERKFEERIFNIITDNSGFQFKLTDGIISVKHMNNRKRKSDSAPMLLKIPEGIYEAKVLSVLLAVKHFKTVCLDDAERGMHPQMIERIRDHVLVDVQDKVVLLITHHPSYIARWNIPRLFLFQRSEDDNGVRFGIKALSELFSTNEQDQSGACGTCGQPHCQELGEKTFQLIAEHNVATLLFARRILFVEGKSDELFISAFLKCLTHDKALLARFIDQRVAEADVTDMMQNFVYFLSGLHIITLNGSANIYKFRPLCHQLNLRHSMILDHDVLSQNLGKNIKGKTNIDKFCNKLHLSIATAERGKIHKLGQVELFESEDLFIWNPKNNGEPNEIYRDISRKDTQPHTNSKAEQTNIKGKRYGRQRTMIRRGKQKAANNENKPSDVQSQQDRKQNYFGKIEGAVQALFTSAEDGEFLKDCLIDENKKLLLDKNVKYDDINEVAQRCAEHASKDKSSDFHRLVKFFYRMSQCNDRQ